MPGNRWAIALLGCSVMSVSTGAIFVRWADAPALVVAAYRVGLAFLIVLVPTLCSSRDELRRLSRGDIKVAMLAGLFLACHFATWIASLDYTSVANSTVLVNTIPLWVGLFGAMVTRERLARSTGVGMMVSAAGVCVIGVESFRLTTDGWRGDLLALAGGVCAAFYLMIGRRLRRRLSLLPYVTICYGAAAMVLWAAVLAFRLPLTNFGLPTAGALLGMAVVSQILGHTAYNGALRYFSAAFVAIALLGEPVLSSLWAYHLFDEHLSAYQALGGLLVLTGIVLAVRGEGSPRATADLV